MTNLEAKQEAIKKAYGEYWEQLTAVAIFIALKNNGWVLEEDLYNDKGTLLDCIEFEKDMHNNFRPKSLQGIENNNGWIRIESEADLPKKAIQCFYVDKYENKVCLGVVDKNDFDNVSHYQPIEKPKPPIF